MSYRAFLDDQKTQDAVIRNLQVIGEAAKKISPATKRRLRGIPWREMSGIRDKVVHDYFGINYDIVWQVVARELPEVLGKLYPVKPTGGADRGFPADSLEECHRKLTKLLGSGVEPVEVWRCAERHRAYWRPEHVRVLLLAESHVYTSPSDLSRRVVLPAATAAGVPDGFVRLVYCLGYGENRLLDRPISDPPNSGTPQFWKVFYSCVYRVDANRDFAPVLRRTRFSERIENKLALLRRLKDAGVWLVDASLAALYPRRAPAVVEACLRTSWDCYVHEIVETARPSRIVCIGRGVAGSLGDRLHGLGIPVKVVAQPNARLASNVHFELFQQYHDIVSKALQE